MTRKTSGSHGLVLHNVMTINKSYRNESRMFLHSVECKLFARTRVDESRACLDSQVLALITEANAFDVVRLNTKLTLTTFMYLSFYYIDKSKVKS